MKRFAVVLGALLAAGACSSNKSQERQDPMPSGSPAETTPEAPAEQPQETQGRLMLQEDGSWAVQRQDGAPLPIAVTYETEFLGPDGSPVSATQFTEGKQVRVTYEERGAGPALVSRVELMEQAGGSTMPPMDRADPGAEMPEPGAGMPDDDEMSPSDPGMGTTDPGTTVPRRPGSDPRPPGQDNMPSDPQTDPLDPTTPMDDSRL